MQNIAVPDKFKIIEDLESYMIYKGKQIPLDDVKHMTIVWDHSGVECSISIGALKKIESVFICRSEEDKRLLDYPNIKTLTSYFFPSAFPPGLKTLIFDEYMSDVIDLNLLPKTLETFRFEGGFGGEGTTTFKGKFSKNIKNIYILGQSKLKKGIFSKVKKLERLEIWGFESKCILPPTKKLALYYCYVIPRIRKINKIRSLTVLDNECVEDYDDQYDEKTRTIGMIQIFRENERNKIILNLISTLPNLKRIYCPEYLKVKLEETYPDKKIMEFGRPDIKTYCSYWVDLP